MSEAQILKMPRKQPHMRLWHHRAGVGKYVCNTPDSKSSCGQHGARLGSVGPRWAPCWPHEPCYQGHVYIMIRGWIYRFVNIKVLILTRCQWHNHQKVKVEERATTCRLQSNITKRATCIVLDSISGLLLFSTSTLSTVSKLCSVLHVLQKYGGIGVVGFCCYCGDWSSQISATRTLKTIYYWKDTRNPQSSSHQDDPRKRIWKSFKYHGTYHQVDLL